MERLSRLNRFLRRMSRSSCSRHWLSFCFLLLLTRVACAGALEPVGINQPATNLGRHLQYWIVPDGGSADLASVAQLPDTAWTPVDKETPNFGFTAAAYWFRVSIKNEFSSHSRYLLEFAYPALDLIDLTVNYSNRKSAHFLTGDSLPFETRPVEHHNFVIPIQLEAGESAQLIFKIQTEGALQIPLVLYEEAQFYANDQRDIIAVGAYFGILAIMGMYNLFIFTAIRDRSYIFYTFSMLASAFMQLALHGLGFQFVWRNQVFFNHYAIPLSISLNIIFTCIFSMAFLQLKELYKFIYTIFRFFVLAGLFCVLLTITGAYNLASQLSAAIGIVGCCAFLAGGWTLWLKGHQHARYYALAWTSVLVLTILLGLNKFGILPRTAFTEYSMQVGGILEAVLLSFALADRINTEKREKFRAQEQALALEKRARSEQERALRLEIEAKEDQMRHRERIIEAENKAKNQFIMVMSHELRTPLNGILGLASLLKGNHLAPDQHDHYLDVINLSGHSLLNLLQSILDYSRIDSENIEAEFEEVNIQTACNEVTQLFSPIAARKNLAINLNIDPAVPHWVNGDGARLRQILLNLVGNAEKFTEAGSIQISVTAKDGWLKFEIQDTGIGIAANKLESLFQPFNQVDTGTTRRYGGAGMGLSLCKRLVDVLGGEIGVRSELGQGSTFWFTLPYKDSQNPRARSANDERFLFTTHTVDWPTKKALIVEDNAVNRMVVMGMLKKIGMQYETAEDGLQALAKTMAENANYDVILMDCDMPVMDGYTATENIREWEKKSKRQTLPIIALTAQIAPEHVAKALRSGMSAHLGKPITTDQLEKTLRRYLASAIDTQQSAS